MANKMSVVTEFGVFGIGLALIVAAVAVFLTQVMGGNPSPERTYRGTIILWSLLGPACLCALMGVLLMIYRSVWAVVACVIAGFLVPVSHISAFVYLTGRSPTFMTNAILVAIPVIMCTRAPKAVAEIRTSAPQPPPLPPGA